jgi:hypothetical protein
MENTGAQNIVTTWILWHFYEMPKFLLSIWKNYFLFGLNFLSIPLLLKTFFSPWRRYNWVYPKFFDIKEFFNTLVSNAFSRILGAICRTGLILIGIMFQITIILAGVAAILFWILFPFILAGGIIFILTF